MSYLDAFLLAIIQGITEFLPISSSAHLIILSYILETSSNLFYDVSLHLGTLIAVCAYFKNEIKDTFNQINVQKSIFSNNLLTNLFISSLPTLFLGFLFVNFIDNNLRNTLVISVTTIFFALVLWIATLRAPRKNELAEISLNEALIIGLAQSISLIPGTSRSGITISAGLLLGLDTKTATKFSFLMSIPTIGAIAAYQILSLDLGNLVSYIQFNVLGLFVSFLVAYLTIDIFMKFIEKIGFLPFIIYRLVLGMLLVAYFLK
tara:strand:- start:161 stop:946 length:786 start_codon:yes stop_codon:yes gene_type:complete